LLSNRCPCLHEKVDGSFDIQSFARLPHVSANIDSHGVQRFEVRPPVTESMNVFFNPEGLEQPKPVLGSKMLEENLVRVTINPQFLFTPEWHYGAAARNCGYVNVPQVKGGGSRTAWRSYESDNKTTREAAYLIHDTSIKSALDIIKCNGLMWATDKPDAPGGQGVYGFKVDNADDTKHCLDALCDTQTGGYNRGAGIIFRTWDLVFNSSYRDIIPQGS